MDLDGTATTGADVCKEQGGANERQHDVDEDEVRLAIRSYRVACELKL